MITSSSGLEVKYVVRISWCQNFESRCKNYLQIFGSPRPANPLKSTKWGPKYGRKPLRYQPLQHFTQHRILSRKNSMLHHHLSHVQFFTPLSHLITEQVHEPIQKLVSPHKQLLTGIWHQKKDRNGSQSCKFKTTNLKVPLKPL